MACMWKSENNIQESTLSFHCMGFSNQTLIIKFGGRHLSQLNHPAAYFAKFLIPF